MQEEKFFKCPFCHQKISVVLDLTTDGTHSYVEDCEVCCHPIEMAYEVENNQLMSFSYTKSYE